MTRRKTIVSILAIAILSTLIMLGGCKMITDTVIDNPPSGTDPESDMWDHMYQKYHFTDYEKLGITYNGDIWRYDELTAYPRGGDPEADTFEIRRFKDEQGNYHCSDNYFALLIRDDMERFALDEASGYFSTCKVFYAGPTHMMNDALGPDSTIQDMFSMADGNQGVVDVLVPEYAIPEQGFQEAAQALADDLRAQGARLVFSVVLLSAEDYERSSDRIVFQDLIAYEHATIDSYTESSKGNSNTGGSDD